jgi:hypothetical protein
MGTAGMSAVGQQGTFLEWASKQQLCVRLLMLDVAILPMLPGGKK